ncbi:MAG TPA: FAD binding domain-containing protein [Ilumatobacter sp.]|nr:FAD binding domain-containing protein [Ilumatobacter sp.]
MPVLIPHTLADAVGAFAMHPEALALAGGTDLMVEVNEGHRSIPWGSGTVVSLNRVPELTSYTIDPQQRTVTIGAAVTWATIEAEPLRSRVPALAEAARTVGSPQIRNVGTVGGNLATCSPAGDGLPVLAALDAIVTLASADGTRTLPVRQFMVGVKRTALEPGELITSITLPVLDGWQGYSKVGVRNAMVIATASACVAVDAPTRSVRIALGSVAPTIIRCDHAEQIAAAGADWGDMRIAADVVRDVAEAAAAASRPIDDHRSTAAYRRHAVAVMVSRLFGRAFASEVPT